MKHEKFEIPLGEDDVTYARSTERAVVSLHCALRGATSEWRQVRVSDLSPLGFRVWWHEEARPGMIVKLRIAGFEDLAARVRWATGRWIGCAFVQPLNPYVFEHIAAGASGRRSSGVREC